MLKIRLSRMGSIHNPIYRVVVSDSRKRPTSRYLDRVGQFDPNQEPPMVDLDLEKIDAWTSKGAQMSSTVSDLVKKARRSAAAAPAEAEA